MRLAILALSILINTPPVGGASLRPETTAAFEEYIKGVEDSLSRLPEDQKKYRRLARTGEVAVHDSSQVIKVPEGLIHDWMGTTFIRGGEAEEVVNLLLREFNRHAGIYADIIASEVLECSPDFVRGHWRLRKTKLATVVLNVEMAANYDRVDDSHWYVASRSTRVAEVKNAGEPDERVLAPGEGKGFLWRLNAYWWIEQAEDGAYVRTRTISLTRDAPALLGWLIRPMIEDVPRESLVATLAQTRDAVAEQ